MANTKKYKESMTMHIRTEVETVGELDKIALKDGTSRTEIINTACKQYIRKRGVR